MRRGSQVVRRDDAESPTFRVQSVRKAVAKVRAVAHPDGTRLSPDEQPRPRLRMYRPPTWW